MHFLFEDGPIIACSSGGQATTAIAIVRLGGFDALSDLNQFFSFPLSKVLHRKVFLTSIVEQEQSLDRIVAVFYSAPHSFNGENILELFVHGNPLNVSKIIQLFIEKAKFRLAREGEFTYRALRNKKLSMTQVEGLDLLLHATTDYMLQQGQDVLAGQLHESYKQLHDRFLQLKAAVELSIDFLEDVGEESAQKNLLACGSAFFSHLHSLYGRVQGNLNDLISPQIVVFGPPNAGKSSLFNIFCRSDRAIVSAKAGTTRDFISENISIKGQQFRLIDTAGIRESQDEIENVGVLKAIKLLNHAFFRIFVFNPFDSDLNIEFFSHKVHELEFLEIDLLILTRKDHPLFTQMTSQLKIPFKVNYTLTLSLVNDSYDIELYAGHLGKKLECWKMDGPIGPQYHKQPFFSAGPIGPMTENIINALEKPIIEKLNSLLNSQPILIQRHRQLITEIFHNVQEFRKIFNREHDIGIVSSELNLIGNKIAELIGIITPNDVLATIFTQFCIGK